MREGEAAAAKAAVGSDDGDGDSDDESSDGERAPPPMKKAKAAPAPKTSVGKAVGGRPLLNYKPTPYLNGRIYYSTPKACFRAYKHTADAVDTVCAISVHGSAKKAWAAACAAIEKDKRNK